MFCGTYRKQYADFMRPFALKRRGFSTTRLGTKHLVTVHDGMHVRSLGDGTF